MQNGKREHTVEPLRHTKRVYDAVFLRRDTREAACPLPSVSQISDPLQLMGAIERRRKVVPCATQSERVVNSHDDTNTLCTQARALGLVGTCKYRQFRGKHSADMGKQLTLLSVKETGHIS